MGSDVRLVGAMINVRHLDESIPFYEDVLGLRTMLREGSGAVLSSGEGADTTVLFLRELGSRAVRASAGLGLQWVGWHLAELSVLDRVEKKFRSRGCFVSRHSHGGVEFLSGHDPDRTKILVFCTEDGGWPYDYEEVPAAVYMAE